MGRANSLKKTPMLRKIEVWRRKGQQIMRWLDGIDQNQMDMSLSKLWEMVKGRMPGVLQPMGHKESDTTYQLNNNRQVSTVHQSLAPGSTGCCSLGFCLHPRLAFIILLEISITSSLCWMPWINNPMFSSWTIPSFCWLTCSSLFLRNAARSLGPCRFKHIFILLLSI